jgi:hypothetical protein
VPQRFVEQKIYKSSHEPSPQTYDAPFGLFKSGGRFFGTASVVDSATTADFVNESLLQPLPTKVLTEVAIFAIGSTSKLVLETKLRPISTAASWQQVGS